MTHSRVMATGLTANGVDLTRSDLRILCRITSGLYGGLEYRGVDTIIPHRAGRTRQPRKPDYRTIVAEGSLFGAGANELVQRADLASLLADLDALMREDQEPYELEATLLDGSTATIMACPSGFDPIDPIEAPAPTTYMTVRLEWVSVDPDWEFNPAADISSITWQDDDEVTDEWQAETAYTFLDLIIAGGAAWYWNSADGTSGTDLPDFDPEVSNYADGDGGWSIVPAWAAETEIPDDPLNIIQPTTPNGHTYHPLDGGTTGTEEPTWPTDGGTVEDPAP